VVKSVLPYRITLRTVTRTDVSKLAKFARTGAGAARLPATTSRTGCQHYPEDGLVEYRPPEEVFSEDSLASYASVPVTLGHPPVAVTPANMREYQIGHVTDAPPEARVKVDGSANEWVKTTLVIGDGESLDSIAQGAEVSCGYSCELDRTPGVDPVTGEKYDAIQRKIRLNHVAVLIEDQKARAGAEAKLRLDQQNMIKILIDGVEYEKGSDAHLNKLKADADTALAVANKRADTAEGACAAEKKRADAAEAKASVQNIDAAVTARFALLKRAAQFLPGTYECDGKSDAEIVRDCVATQMDAKELEGKSADFIAGCFARMAPTKAEWGVPAGSRAPVKADATPDLENDDDAFRKHLDAQLKDEGK
jgi:hypothetical protein